MDVADGLPLDQSLLRRCLAGDGTAWVLLEEYCRDHLLATIRLTLGRKAGDEYMVSAIYAEVLGHLFSKDCHALRQYDGERPWKPYLAKIAWRVALRHLRSLRKWRSRASSLPPGQEVVCQMLSCSTPAELEEFVAGLSPRLKQVYYYLTENPGGPLPDGITPANLRKLLHRLRQAFHEFLRGA